MNNKEIFLIRCTQLKNCLEHQSPEDMLTISQILRQFLIDGERLIDLVNRDYHLPIFYEVGLSTEERDKEMESLGLPIQDSLHFLGAFPPNDPRRKIKRDEFLNFKIVSYQGRYFSVTELIDACANRFGGVHSGNPDKDNSTQSKIREMGDLLREFGLPGAFSSLVLIGSIVEQALNELLLQIKS